MKSVENSSYGDVGNALKSKINDGVVKTPQTSFSDKSFRTFYKKVWGGESKNG